jgi:hypothetical protein
LQNQQHSDFSEQIIGSLFDINEISESGTPKPKVIVPDNMVKIKTAAEKELGLTLPPPGKDIRKDKYRSENILKPKSRAEHDKYMKIYVDYVSSKSTQIELAKKYAMSHVHINRIIKYAVHQMGDIDQSAELRALVDGLEVRKTKIQAEIEGSLEVDEKAKLWIIMNKTDKLLAQLKGLLSTAIIDMSDNREVHVQMHPELENNRRTGSDAKSVKDGKVVEVKGCRDDDIKGDEINDQGDINAAPFERRTGSDINQEEK